MTLLYYPNSSTSQDIWAWEARPTKGQIDYKVLGHNRQEIFSPSIYKPEILLVVSSPSGFEIASIPIEEPFGEFNDFCVSKWFDDNEYSIYWESWINVQPFSEPAPLPGNVCEGDLLDLSITNEGYEGHQYSFWVSRDLASWQLVSEQFMETANPQKHFQFDFSEANVMSLFGYSDPEMIYGTYWFKAEATTCYPGSIQSHLWNFTDLQRQTPIDEIEYRGRYCSDDPITIYFKNYLQNFSGPVDFTVASILPVEEYGCTDNLISGEDGSQYCLFQVLYEEELGLKLDVRLSRLMLPLDPGYFVLYLEAENSCLSDPFIFEVNEIPPLSIESISNSPSCEGNDDGYITVKISGGVQPYLFNGNEVESQFIIERLSAGNFEGTIADYCTPPFKFAQEIEDGPPFVTSVLNQSDPTCKSNGSFEVKTNYQGDQGVLYHISDGVNEWVQEKALFTNLHPGTYSVTTTINNKCQFGTETTLNSPPDIEIEVSNSVPICSDGDGFMILTSEDQTFDITYELNGDFITGSVTEADLENDQINIPVPSGDYDLIIQNNCKDQLIYQGNFTIASIYPVSIEPIEDQVIQCADGLTGILNFKVLNGTDPYTVSLEGQSVVDLGAGDYEISGLRAGDYSILVEDNCRIATSEEFSVIVANGASELLLDQFEVISQISCKSAGDASILVKASGGSPFPDTNKDYLVKLVRDENEFDPNELEGARNEFIFENLGPGKYYPVVMDNNGCEKSFEDQSISIVDPPLLIIEPITPLSFGPDQVKLHDNHLKISCAGDLVDFFPEINGGTGEYSFTLEGGTLDEPLTQLESFGDLGSGSYFFTVRDENGCTDQLAFTLNDPPALSTSLNAKTYSNQKNISCVGETDGEVKVTVSGGLPPYDYMIDAEGSTPIFDRYEQTWTFSSLPVDELSTTYRVTVTDFLGCEIGSEVNLEAPLPPSLNYEILSTTTGVFEIPCKGEYATLSFKASGGDGVNPYKLLINDEVSGFFQMEDSSFVHDFTAGTYDIKVMDELGCQSQLLSLILSEPEQELSMTTETISPVCIGGNNGQIVALASGGISPYEFKIDDFPWQNENSYDGLEAGTYSIHVRDANQCVNTTTAVVSSNPSPLTLELVEKVAPSCHHGTNGSITVRTINYKPGDDNLLRYYISGGHYGTDVIEFTEIVDPIAIEHQMIFENLWDTKDPNFVATYYEIWVEDDNKCQELTNQYLEGADLALSAPEELILEAEIRSPSCNEGNNGWFIVSVIGGTPPYYFSRDNINFISSNTSDVSKYQFDEISSGDYEIFVRDANYDPNQPTCLSRIDVRVPEGLEILVNSQIEHVSCAGGNDGSISLNPEAFYQNAGYNIDNERLHLEWSYGNTIFEGYDQLDQLYKGNYSLELSYDQDSVLCFQQIDFKVHGPSRELAFSGIKTYPSTCGESDKGRAIIEFEGGWADSIAYFSLDDNAWKPVLSSSVFLDQLTVGDHHIKIAQSAFQCVEETGFTIRNSQISIDTLFLNPPACSGAEGGRLVLSANNVIDPVFQIIDSSYTSTSGEFIGLLQNKLYRISVYDQVNASCLSDTISFFFPGCEDDTDDLRITGVPVIQSATCGEASDGSARVIVSGGLPPYNYYMNGNESPNGDLSDLSFGSHQVVVTDQLDKRDTAYFNVPFLENMETSTVTTSRSTCEGKCDGSAIINITGGSGNYEIIWADGYSGFSRFDLCPGAHQFRVVDVRNNVCRIDGQVNILEYEPLAISEVMSLQPTCSGNKDGKIEVSGTGGSGSYSFEWGNGVRGPTLASISAGEYELTLIDNLLGCSTTQPFQLIDPSQLFISDTLITSPTCENSSNGSIQLFISNAVAPLVKWQDGAIGLVRRNLRSGTYPFTITSAGSCEISGTIEVPERPALQVLVEKTDNNCHGICAGEIQLSVTGGQSPFSIKWDSGQRGLTRTNLCNGIYSYEVTDRLGCSVSGSVEIGSPEPLSINLIEMKNVSCHRLADGVLYVEGNGGSGSYAYQWTNGSTDQKVDALIPGSYGVTIIDENGCSTYASFVISQPPSLFLAEEVIIDPSCDGMNDGSILVTAAGGNPDYNYLWDHEVSERFVEDLSHGTYHLEIEDINGCTFEKSYNLSAPSPLKLVNVSAIDPACYGESNGQISVNVTGGTKPYNYQWSTGHETFAIESLSPDTYDLTITDQNGCMISSSFILSDPDPLEIAGIDDFTLLCKGGSLVVSPEGEWLNYFWSGPYGFKSNANSVELYQDGVYELTLADHDGCTVSKSFELEISESVLKADFIRISEAVTNEPLVFLDISLPVPDGVSWILPVSESLVVSDMDDHFVELIFTEPGDYEIGMQASYQNCYSEQFKIITIEENPNEDLSGARIASDVEMESTIYPNPTANKINILIETESKELITVKLFNMANEEIVMETLSGRLSYLIQWYLSEIPSGVYFLTLQKEKEIQQKRILVMR